MQLSINEKNTIQNFASVMTDASKVVSELIQNSRRAGASEVRINYDDVNNVFQIEDNGSGIEDFENLITLSESGWNATTQDSDSPFGMGFFSTLFTADTVVVESNGQTLTIDTKKALNFEEIPAPTPFSQHDKSGTAITLFGFNSGSSFNVAKKVTSLAAFSSIDIYFNGELLESPKSLHNKAKEKEVVETPFGQLVIERPYTNDVALICQDLLIGDETYKTNYLYLNNTVQVRMPDRDAIVDSAQFEIALNEWLNNYWKNELKTLRCEFDDDVEFLNECYNQVLRYSSETLNEIEFLPSDAFTYSEKPAERKFFTDVESTYLRHGFFKQEFSEQIVHNIENFSEKLVAQQFFFFASAVKIDKNIPKDHWVYNYVITEEDCSAEQFVVSVPNGQLLNYTLEHGNNGDALIFDECVIIKHQPTGKAASINNHQAFALYSDSDYFNSIICDGKKINPILVIGNNANIEESLLIQVESYQSEFDEDRDTDLNQDTESLDKQVKAFCTDDVRQLLSDLIGDIPPILQSKLEGQKLTAEIVDGKVVFA